MRSGSQSALDQAKDRWEALELDSDRQFELGKDIFAVVDVLRANHSIATALESGARSQAARSQLATELFQGKVADEVVELLIGLVRQSWSQVGDLVIALEKLGVHALLLSARARNALGVVEEELYQIQRTYAHSRDLRLALTAVNKPLSARMDFVAQLLPNQDRVTVALAQRSLTGDKTIVSNLVSYIRAAAAMAKHLVAAVTAAIPLNDAQLRRLQEILEAKYKSDVKIHVSIDTSVIGGLRIRIQDDVIDGTLASRLNAVQAAFKN